MTRVPAFPLLALLRLYQWLISPLLGYYAQCRFTPTCSAYAYEAIQRHGPLKGLRLAIHRLLRCHPCAAHGHDPVPH